MYLKVFFLSFRFGARQSNQSSVVTGVDYEDVRRDDNRRDGNRRHNNKGSEHRYHRDKNGTLNYHDYEDVEKDRRKFLGKSRRHEAEEVDQERYVHKVLRQLALLLGK